tara:strand:+ start:8587 stop:10503 length:1917 start_codon:yes stop_codon:yes gene_type:complete
MERQDNQYTNKKSLIIILKESLLNEIYIKHVKHKINLLKMAEMNKIKSFRSFSDVLAHEAVIKLAVENNAKRSELSTKIASILDSMEITSFEGLEEEQKTAIISQLFGEISEEETEENLPEVSDEEEQQVDEAKFVKDFNKDVLNAKTREEVLELYPNAEFFTGKSDHFFGELDNNLFFKAYYTKAQKEFSIKSVYSEKGSNYVHLYNRIGESLVTEGKSEVNAFLSMISKDYQFDKKHDDYTGFLNTDPSDMDDVAIEFINNVDKYKSLMKKHGLSLEPGYSDEEAIFVKESVVNEMKKRSPYIKDDLVYNTRTETVGIVRTDDDGSGEVKTDADGNVNVDELEVYMPFKYNYKNAKISSSTKKEVIKRRLFYPFNESVVNEAIKVEGKRDAKKVVTVYNKIFNKVLVDLGAMSTESILGCIKYLTFEAMGDANFHREADAVSKMIKGNIKPLEIKMNGLGGHFIKIGPATIKSILDKYYSDIANAAGWSGIGIVEGTALYLEQIKQEAMGQAAINKFNQAFEGEDIRVDLDSKINESNEVESITVSDEATKLEERNAFLGARAKAIEEDLEEFEFNGKTYPVTINEDSLSEEVVTEEVEEVEEGNAFGDAVRKAKEAGDKEFEFEGKTYKVEEANN